MSYLSELGGSNFEQRNTEELLTRQAPVEERPGVFQNTMKSVGNALMRGTVNMMDLFATAGPDLTSAPEFYDYDPEPSNLDPADQAQLGQQFREEARRKTLERFTPDPKTIGVAGRVMGGVAEFVPTLLTGPAAPFVAAGTQTLAGGKHLVDEGVDAGTAGVAAAVEGAATYTGFKLPILGSTLAQRLATGAVGNTAVNAGATFAEQQTLRARGYDELAKNYDPADLEARAVDVVSGLVFGGLHHLSAPSERDAVATVNNAKHFQQDTAPGIAENPNASAAHQGAMQDATEQLLRGEPVNVDPRVTRAEFKPRSSAGNPIPEDLHAFDAAREEWLQRNENLKAATGSGESVKPGESAGADEGYSVGEGELTDEQRAQFEGLRAGLPAAEKLDGPGARASGEPGHSDDGPARGEPLRVYRGAARELDAADFGSEALGHATGHPSSGLGVFFTSNKGDAAKYGNVSEHALDIRNPKVIPVEDLPGFNTLAEATAFREQLRAEGYDGMVIDARHLGGPVNYVAFEHGQIVKAAKAKAAAKTQAKKPASAPEPKTPEPAAAPSGDTAAEAPEISAIRAHLADTDMLLPTVDADGNSVARSARELMAEADAEVAEAKNTGKGIAAAVSCLLTRGA